MMRLLLLLLTLLFSLSGPAMGGNSDFWQSSVAAKTAAQEQYFIAGGVRRSLSSLQNGVNEIPATIVRSGPGQLHLKSKKRF